MFARCHHHRYLCDSVRNVWGGVLFDPINDWSFVSEVGTISITIRWTIHHIRGNSFLHPKRSEQTGMVWFEKTARKASTFVVEVFRIILYRVFSAL